MWDENEVIDEDEQEEAVVELVEKERKGSGKEKGGEETVWVKGGRKVAAGMSRGRTTRALGQEVVLEREEVEELDELESESEGGVVDEGAVQKKEKGEKPR